jgi:essential nuclear protein 1
MPKVTSSRAAAAARRHNPLAEDIIGTGHLRTDPTKKNKRRSKTDGDQEDGERFVDAKTSRKILQIGQELADEEDAEQKAARVVTATQPKSAFDFESRFEEEDVFSDEDGKFNEEQWDDEEEIEEVVCDRGLPAI